MQNLVMKLMMNPKVLNLLTKNPLLLQAFALGIMLLGGVLLATILGLIFSNFTLSIIVFAAYLLFGIAMTLYATKKFKQTQQEQMEMMAAVFGSMFQPQTEGEEDTEDVLPDSFDEQALKNMIESMKKQS